MNWTVIRQRLLCYEVCRNREDKKFDEKTEALPNTDDVRRLRVDTEDKVQ